MHRRALIAGGAAFASFSLLARAGRAESAADVVIVGAGMAGLAAAQELAKLGKSFVLLEAGARIGGRAHTDIATFGAPFDRGCAWLHSANKNPLAPIAKSLGFSTFNDKNEPWLYLDGDEASEQDYERLTAAEKGFERAIDAAGKAGRDISVASAFPIRNRFDRIAATRNGPSEFGVDLEDLSTLDAYRQEGSEVDRLVPRGLGAMVAAYGAQIPVQLGAPVTRLSWKGAKGPSAVRVETTRGAISAGAAIITVSNGVLASGAIAFDPPLPAERQRDLANVPMGLLNKVALQFQPGALGKDKTIDLTIQDGDGEPTYFLLRPFGLEMAIALIGGSRAREMERAGERAAVDAVLTALKTALGGGIGRRLVKSAMTSWASDPLTLGSYAMAKPGAAASRRKLSQPLEDRLFFAGEATHPTMPATLHGAYLSGIEAARRAGKVV